MATEILREYWYRYMFVYVYMYMNVCIINLYM